MKRTLSFSGLKEYNICQKRYYYRKVKGYSPAMPEVVSYGKAYHKALELFYKAIINDEADDYLSTAEWIASSVFDEFGLFGSERDKALETFVNYVSGLDYDSKFNNIKGLEIKLGAKVVDDELVGCPFDEADVRGIIDKLYVLPSGVIIIVDYKTGASLQYDERQMWFYASLIDVNLDKFCDINPYRCVVGVFEFPRFDYETQITMDRMDIMAHNDALIAQIKQIQTQATFPPTVGEHCAVCPFRAFCEDVKDDLKGLPDDLSDEGLLERYFRLQAESETIKAILKDRASDHPLIVGDYEIGYRERKSYIWDIEAVIEDIEERNLTGELIKLDSRKALKYDWVKEKGLKTVKKSTSFGIYKAKK